jgi:glucose/arabinose dehydrogenase
MKSQLPHIALYGGLLAAALACVSPQAHRLGFAASAAPAGAAATSTRKSGYAIGDETCGTAPSAFPKLRIGMRAGYCAGLVASQEDGLVFPRSIVQVPDSRLFVVVDMGGWGAGRGRLLLLDPQAPAGKRVTVLIAKLDYPHGLGVGIDRRVYASTDTKVFRFDPLAKKPETTMEVILQGLPGRRVTLSDGTKIEESAHPLKHFVFDRTGRIYVNVGAPTDRCATGPVEAKRCAAGEGAAPLASIWAFTPPAGGIFPALKPGDANPAREIYARGLRNSMALAVHPDFPAEGSAFLQGENGRDLPDLFEPNEELNAVEKGRHYGWPYCYDLKTVSSEYRAFLQGPGDYHNLCGNAALYKEPHSLMPPHAAPLAMLYYQGEKFSELKGKLLVGLHGYRPTGSRVVFYDVDAQGFPTVSAAPVNYNVSCAAEPTRAFQTEQGGPVAAAPFNELIVGWHRVNGVRPQGAPVGLTVADDGALWLVEDKNQTIIRIDAAPQATVDQLPCEARTEDQIKELMGFVDKSGASRMRLSQVRTQLIEKHCFGCHSDFDLKDGMSDAQKDTALLHFLLAQDGWIYPGDPDAGRMHSRVWGKGAEMVMPANGRELIATDAAYKQLLGTLDLFVADMVPGARKRLKLGQRVAQDFRNRSGTACGSLPNNTVVVVVDAKPKEKPLFSRIFRPADLYLNGMCADGDGYYIEQKYLGGI